MGLEAVAVAPRMTHLERLEAEQHNLRAALAWGLETEPGLALRLALVLSNTTGFNDSSARAASTRKCSGNASTCL